MRRWGRKGADRSMHSFEEGKGYAAGYPSDAGGTSKGYKGSKGKFRKSSQAGGYGSGKAPGTAFPAKSHLSTLDLEAFVEALREHCSDDSLIKGWEADRRVCVGRDRAALRAAAKDVRQKAFRTEQISSSQSQVTTSNSLSRQEWLYVEALSTLHSELAKAYESDFDSMLKDGLEWLEERLRLHDKKLKSVLDSVYKSVGCDLLRRLKDQRASGHRGRAIDRDLRQATVWHGQICDAWSVLDETEESQLSYLKSVEGLLAELAKEGEPDFDGKLRQAINFLEHGGERLCY